jgi:pimeloyl-ACP methyl ester carboxylesterase
MPDVATFTTFDGTRLAHRSWGEPSPDRVPVLLHHGFAVDARLNWEAPGIVGRLVDEGHHVIAIDAIGHGSSEKPHDPDRYGEDRMARDVSALLDHLGLDRVDLVGYSMGAVVSVVTATQEDRIRRLAVGGVGAGIVEQGGVDQRQVSRDLIADVLEADDPTTVSTEEAALAFRALADTTGADRHALAAQARRARQGPLDLTAITVPTLVLAGADDPLADRPGVLCDAIAEATLAVVPGDHLGAVTSPELADALVSFLAEG